MAEIEKHIEIEIDEDIARTVRLLQQLSLLVPHTGENDEVMLVRDQVELLRERVDWTKINVLKLVGHIALLRAKVRDNGGAHG